MPTYDTSTIYFFVTPVAIDLHVLVALVEFNFVIIDEWVVIYIWRYNYKNLTSR